MYCQNVKGVLSKIIKTCRNDTIMVIIYLLSVFRVRPNGDKMTTGWLKNIETKVYMDGQPNGR